MKASGGDDMVRRILWWKLAIWAHTLFFRMAWKHNKILEFPQFFIKIKDSFYIQEQPRCSLSCSICPHHVLSCNSAALCWSFLLTGLLHGLELRFILMRIKFENWIYSLLVSNNNGIMDELRLLVSGFYSEIGNKEDDWRGWQNYLATPECPAMLFQRGWRNWGMAWDKCERNKKKMEKMSTWEGVNFNDIGSFPFTI